MKEKPISQLPRYPCIEFFQPMENMSGIVINNTSVIFLKATEALMTVTKPCAVDV